MNLPNNDVGVLLINLGTPDAPTVSAVRRYLREFLSDPEVIDLPAFFRWLLLRLIILPLRSKRSAQWYQKIWTDRGSPLFLNSQYLLHALSEKMGGKVKIALGMRYGNPSLVSALNELSDCRRVMVLPLFPQYATATTRSAIKAIQKLNQNRLQDTFTITDFFSEEAYIKSFSSIIHEALQGFQADFLLMSYHGIPERQLDKNLCRSVSCDHQRACPFDLKRNYFCYRAQCYRTSELLADKLSLTKAQYGVVFQSRLGRLPWIKPYTNDYLTILRKKQIKRLAVVCPSFVGDCLETLEEIGIRTQEQWKTLGGEAFKLIPALNANPIWVEELAKMLENTLSKMG